MNCQPTPHITPGCTSTAGISVIVPVYNGEAFLGDALASILAQSAPVSEVIVIDDGSTDRSAALARSFDDRVRCIQQENRGPAAARNHGLRHVSNAVIGFLDADDIWSEGAMNRQYLSLQSDDRIDVVKGLSQFIYQAAEGLFQPRGNPLPFWNLGGALFRRTVFDRVGLLDESLRFSEDLDWFNRARELGVRIDLLDQVTQLHRRHAGNMTKDLDFRAVDGFDMIRMALQRRRNAQDRQGHGSPS